MVQGVSLNCNCHCNSVAFGKGIQKKQQDNPPAEILNELKQAGIPEDVISQGRDAVMSYAQQNNIALPKPPAPPEGGQSQGVGEDKKPSEPPAGSKSQGAAHSNKHSMLKRETDSAIKTLMEENNIASTGMLKDDIQAIKTTLAGLDKDAAAALKDKFKLAGLAVEELDKNEATQKAFKGTDQLASMNKHLLVKNSLSKAKI